MVKIVHVLQVGMTSNIGGLETYLMQQFRHIDRTKLQYDFVNITSEREMVFKNEIIAAGSKVYEICSRHGNPLLHYLKWIILLSRVSKYYDVIVLNSNGLTYIFPLLAARFFGIPMRVIHSHNSSFEQPIGILKKILIKVNKILLKWNATDYFACSKIAGNWMFGKGAHYRVIHNATDFTKFVYDPVIRGKVREKLNLEDKFVIGHVGRFSYQKNHDFIIDIFSAIHKRRADAVLLLVGDAVGDKSLLDLAKLKVHKLNLDDAVFFLGLRDDVPELMQAMDCFILPSLFEGLAVVGIEAQVAGLHSFFSDTITKEIGITRLAHFIPLHAQADVWRDEILNTNFAKRYSPTSEVREAGYDINLSIKEIEELYTKR